MSATPPPSFVQKLFKYPSHLSNAFHTLLILIYVSWVSWLLFFLTIPWVIFQFGKQILSIIKDNPPEACPKVVLITGASAGIGQALAIKYIQEGAHTVYITGRSTKGLEETISKCNSQLAKTTKTVSNYKVIPLQLDVTDENTMRTKLQEINTATPIDLVIANAGISPEQQQNKSQELIYRDTYNTNITGVVNTIFPLYDSFVSRRSGHFVLISSIASFGSIAHPAYSSSKSLITTLAQGLRRDLKPYGVKVTAVCPGFILTNMTSERDTQRRQSSTGFIAKVKSVLGLSGLPFIRPVEDAVDVIYEGLQLNFPVIVFPFRLGFLAWVLKFLPFTLVDYMGLIMAKLVYRGDIDSTDPNSGTTKPVQVQGEKENKKKDE